MTELNIYIKLASLPENLKKEVEDFVDFLKAKEATEKSGPQKKAGLAKGLIKMGEDFDHPLSDFKDYM